MGTVSGRHEVNDSRSTSLGFELSFEDERARTIASAHAQQRSARRNQPAAILGACKQGGKARSRIEPRPAQPVDGTVAPDQGGRVAVPNQGIGFNWEGHCSVLRLRVLAICKTPPPVAMIIAAKNSIGRNLP